MDVDLLSLSPDEWLVFLFFSWLIGIQVLLYVASRQVTVLPYCIDIPGLFNDKANAER